MVHLNAAAEAARDQQWSVCLQHLRRQKRRLRPTEVVDASLAAEIAWLAVKGSFAIRAELSGIFKTELFATDTERFPHLFSFFLWECGIGQADEAIESSQWSKFTSRLTLLTALPDASRIREEALGDLLDRFVAKVDSAQQELRERFPLMSFPLTPAGTVWTTTADGAYPFECLAMVLDAVSGSIDYPRLGERFARRLLHLADWPVLAHCPAVFLSACWEDTHQLEPSAPAREWIRRLTLLNPDTYSADETL